MWTLGLVSLLMDTSSELIHSLLPLFLVTTLGASTLAVGIIEGIAEATALITKVFSGYLSDYFRNRKVLTMDEDAIVREADAVGRRIWKQVGPVAIPGRRTLG